jgi:serine/threonine protein kinase
LRLDQFTKLLLDKGVEKIYLAEHLSIGELCVIKIIEFKSEKEKENADKENFVLNRLKSDSPYIINLKKTFEIVCMYFIIIFSVG